MRSGLGSSRGAACRGAVLAWFGKATSLQRKLCCLPRVRGVKNGRLLKLPRPFSRDLTPRTMRLNLRVPPSAAVAGQAAGLCLALCLNVHPAGVLPALAADDASAVRRGPGLGRSSPSLIQPHAHAQPRRQLTAALRGAAQVKYKFPPIDRKKVGRCEFSSSAMGQARAHAGAHRSGPP